MEFRLVYEGLLKANRGAADKQAIRRIFHEQLRELLQRPAFFALSNVLNAQMRRGIEHEVGGFLPCSFVSQAIGHIAKLEILMLYGEEPGRGITQAGDLDNRLKTLLDALRAPQQPQEIPNGDVPGPTESPLFCLLEDDSLITALAVTTDRLLVPHGNPAHVLVVIHVTTESIEA